MTGPRADEPWRVAVAVQPPPSGLSAELIAAMLEDVVDLVTGTPQVSAALLVPDVADPRFREIAWPGTPTVTVADGATLGDLLAAIADPGYVAVAAVAPDVPDLPTLLIGKLFSAVAGEAAPAVAICPALAGGVVAVAARLPITDWLAGAAVHLDDDDATATLRTAAPRHGLTVVPGWHRIRSQADLGLLDVGLEGWDATRAALGR